MGTRNERLPDLKEEFQKNPAINGSKSWTYRRILVVDDEEDIAELVRYNLTSEGYHVSCTGSGEDAIRLIRSERV